MNSCRWCNNFPLSLERGSLHLHHKQNRTGKRFLHFISGKTRNKTFMKNENFSAPDSVCTSNMTTAPVALVSPSTTAPTGPPPAARRTKVPKFVWIERETRAVFWLKHAHFLMQAPPEFVERVKLANRCCEKCNGLGWTGPENAGTKFCFI